MVMVASDEAAGTRGFIFRLVYRLLCVCTSLITSLFLGISRPIYPSIHPPIHLPTLLISPRSSSIGHFMFQTSSAGQGLTYEAPGFKRQEAKLKASQGSAQNWQRQGHFYPVLLVIAATVLPGEEVNWTPVLGGGELMTLKKGLVGGILRESSVEHTVGCIPELP